MGVEGLDACDGSVAQGERKEERGSAGSGDGRWVAENSDSDRLLRTLFRVVPDACWAADPQGRMTRVNQALCSLCGFSREDLLGRSWTEIFSEPGSMNGVEFNARVATDGLARVETVLKTREGQEIPVLLSVGPWGDSEHGNVGVCRDLRPARAQECALRERNKELECLYGLAKLIETPGLKLSDMLERAVNLLLPAWRFPDLAGARLQFGEKTYQTSSFRETTHRLWSELRVHGESVGTVEVAYLHQPPVGNGSPFLEEERALLDAVAERLGRVIERVQNEAALEASNARLQALWSVSSLEGANIKTVADHVLKTITQMTGSQYGFYGFMDDDETEMTIHSWSGEAMKDCSLVDRPSCFKISEAGLWAEAVRQRSPLVVNDYEAWSRGKRGTPEGHVPLKKLLVVPFFSRGRIGSLAAVANRDRDYDQHDVQQLDTFLFSIQAIVDAKRAEERVQESHRLLSNLASLVPGVIYQYRLYPDGRSAFPYASPGMKLIYGVTPEAVREDASVVFGRLHPEDYGRVSEAIQESARSLETFYCEFRVELPEQGLRWRWSQAQPERLDDGSTLWHGIILDITDQKEARLALEHAHQLMRYIIEHNRSAIAVHDRDLNYVYVSQRYLDDYKVEASEVIGKHHYEVFPDLPQKWRDVHQRALAGEVCSSEDDPYEKEDGTLEWTRWECRPWYEADGSIGGIIVYTEVTTDRKRAEEERLRLEAQLQHAQKMESIGRLAGGVAHDFNNMLGVILGRAEMCLDEIPEGLRLHHNLQEIQKAARRSADLTRQLLAFARKQTVAPQVLDLNDTVEGMLKMLRRLIGEDIDLVWSPGSHGGRIKVDPSQIDQVLANLCVNARDAISGQGRINIETASVTVDLVSAESRPGWVAGDFICLTVQDNGCGMDDEVLSNLFEPFFTTKGVGEGTGLGLATVYGIVKQNGGFIDVESEPGKGTRFGVYFPEEATTRPAAMADPPPDALKTGHETVFLVEDEPSILSMGVAMLERLGYQVLSASRPLEAMNLAERHQGTIDLLITDVIMPEMNGRDLADKLSQRYPEIKCLFMSGYTADVIAHNGILDQGLYFMQKPFSMMDLSVNVRRVLDEG